MFVIVLHVDFGASRGSCLPSLAPPKPIRTVSIPFERNCFGARARAQPGVRTRGTPAPRGASATEENGANASLGSCQPPRPRGPRPILCFFQLGSVPFEKEIETAT